MLILAMFALLATIGLLCWLLFMLATFALPAFVGLAVGAWAHGTGAGIPGAIIVGLVTALATFACGQFLIVAARPIWLKFTVAGIFVAPAAVAGYHATHGIVKHLMPSEAWQITFSVVGAVAVGVIAFARVAGMAAANGSSGRDIARA